MGDHLIAYGVGIEVDAEVQTWEDDHDMRFTWSGGGARRRVGGLPNLIVGHWTGGEGQAAQVFRTLLTRKTKDGRGLSVHLFIDYRGVIWQFADLEMQTRHASAVNPRSIGVEMQNQGLPRKGKLPKSWAPYPRGVYRDYLKGSDRAMCFFTGDQMEAWVALCETLCNFFNIAKQVPGDPEMLKRGSIGSGMVLRDTMPKRANKTFEGVIGHYHCSRKLDPGTQPLEELVDDGFAVVAP
jgi:hypothetical protein